MTADDDRHATAPERAVETAVESFRVRSIGDERTTACDVEVVGDAAPFGIRATVLTRGGAELLAEFLFGLSAVDPASVEVTVLEEVARERTIDARVTPVRAAPDPAAEQVTAALYGSRVTAYDAAGEWRRVRVPDGYVGWVEAEHVVPPDPPTELPDVIRADVACEGVPGGALPIGTQCVLRAETGDRASVGLRTGLETEVPAEAVATPPDAPDGEAVVETARAFLDTPYEWGGMTTDGIDCSGLVWIGYRVHGLRLPRDTDQQRRVGAPVDRADLEAGDLLFFPGHVAVSLGGSRYVHAHGGSDGVVVSSLAESDPGYLADLEGSLEGCRRLV